MLSKYMYMISSHVRISYRFYQFVTTQYTTDFYTIKLDYSLSISLIHLLAYHLIEISSS